MKNHLKTYYGFSNFRDHQKNIIKDIINKKDTIVIFPTGGGKSLCYQYPATYTGKKSVVISPLISLMTDQMLKLTQLGIKSVCLNNETYSFIQTPKDIKNSTIIYSTPEFLASHLSLFKSIQKDICMFAIDEAHCLSEWGHDFRPSYRQLSIIKKEFEGIPIVALTATATPNVLDDIFNTLNLDDANQYQISSIRENLTISVHEKSDDVFADLDINPEESTIIYTQTRKNVERIHKIIKSYGFPVSYYHAGLPAEQKFKTHNDFINDKVKIIVATICFGMGIDKPDIRKVVNYGSPCNLETYYQEIGRAGRDGMPSKVVLFHSPSDYNTNIFLISKSDSNKKKQNLLNIFQKYIDNTSLCRQEMIEYYFEHGNLSNLSKLPEKCGKCDNCLGFTTKTSTNTENVTSDAKNIIELVASLPINYGISKLINIIRGSKTESGHNRNKYYNIGSHKPVVWWKKLINMLVAEEYLEKKMFKVYTVIDLGDKCIEQDKNLFLHSGKSIPVSKYTTIRNKLAIKNNVAPYMIINDKVLDAIIKKKPKNITQLLEIDGINFEFSCKYGQYFLENYREENKEKKILSGGGSTENESYDLYQKGNNIDEIARLRKLKPLTIESHIVNYLQKNPKEIDIEKIGLTKTIQSRIQDAILHSGKDRLKPIKEILDRDKKNISYFQIKVFLIYRN